MNKGYEEQLRDAYYNQSMYVGRDRLYDYLRKSNADDHPSRRQVMDWLKAQKVWQLHAKPPKRQATKQVAVSKPLRYFQMDLTGPLNRDKGVHYILGLIDVNTKMLFTAALKKKSSLDVANALQEIIRTNGLDISVLQSDNGAEFLGGEVAALLRRYDIKHATSKPHSPWTNGQIERVWGTLKQMLYRFQTASNSNKWVDILPVLTRNYNQTIHRSTGASPNQVLADTAAGTRQEKVIRDDAIKPSMFRFGDNVRLRLRIDNPLDKAKQYYSDEIYSVVRVNKATKRATEVYKIADSDGNTLKGTFNVTDLLKIDQVQNPPTFSNPVRRGQITRSPRMTYVRQKELDELNRIAKPRSERRRA